METIINPLRTGPIVLVVEDNDEARELMAGTLDGEGFAVLEASTVAEAVDLLNAGRVPALVITDVLLPHTSVWELLDYLRANPDLQRVPVLVITATDPEPGIVGADAAMQPLDELELVSTAWRLVASTQNSI